MDEVKREPLEPLRKQWEFEKSPTLTLQLAEEYGRKDDFLSAITVLRSGLAKHPRHLASKVMLARYLVELEQWPEARESLEQVATADPTHLIANKLLVKTCLATGDVAEARNRLDLYTLLNESDPDIEALEDALERGVLPQVEARAEPAGDPGEAGPPLDAGSGFEDAPVELEEETAEPREVEELVAAPVTPERASTRPADAVPEPDGAARDGKVEPPPLPAPAPDRDPEPAAEPAGPAAVFEEPSDTVTPPAVASPAPSDEPFGDLFGASTRESAAVEASGGAADIFALGRPAGRVAAEPETAQPVATLEPGPEAAAEPEAAGETEAPATVSLGHLYLQQGHTGDAERAFEAVLEREPANVAARAGLAAARGGEGGRLSALDLVSRETLTRAAPLERRRAVLAGYLERLRAGEQAMGPRA